MDIQLDDEDTQLPPQAQEQIDQLNSEAEQTRYEYACETCGIEVFYSGRGRKPKFCADHKKTASTSAPRTDDKWKEQLGNRLMRRAKASAELIARFDKVDAQIFWNGAPVLISSAIDWAEADPKVRKLLNSGISKTASVDVMASALLILVPILMHHGLIPAPKRKKPEPAPEEPGKVSADQGYGAL